MDEEKKEMEQPAPQPVVEKQEPLKWDDKIVELVKICLQFNTHKMGLKKEF